MSSKPIPWNRIALLLGIVLTLLIALIVGYALQRSFDRGSVISSGEPLIGGKFELVDHTGRTWTEQDLLGQHNLIYFGFTFCPDICPTELAKVSRALELLPEDAPVSPIFVTIDPERDGPEQVKAYAEAFHPDMVGLTGTAEQIRQAAQAYRVYYARNDSSGSTAYLMDHSSIIYLMGPEGEYVAHFTIESTPEEIAEKVRALL